MGVDRYRVCELYAAGPDGEGSGAGYRVGDRLVLTARHVIAPALAGASGQVLVRPVGMAGWLAGRVEWQDAGADAALVGVEEAGWRAPGGASVLRWGELGGSDPVPCAAVGFPWASVRPDRIRDTAHLYGQLAPLGQLKAGRLDLDVASASPSARAGGSPWAGMSGAGVIADGHLAGVITVDPARYQDRLAAVPVSRLLADPGFLGRLAVHGVRAEAAPVGAAWYLRMPGEQTVSLAPAYRPVSRRFGLALPTLLRPEHGLVPFLGRQDLLDQIISWCQGPAGRPLLLVTGSGGSGKTRLGREACVQMQLVAAWDAGLADDQRRDGTAATRLERPTLLVVDDADLRTGLISALVKYLRWDDAGPSVRLLLLARAAGPWWDQLVRQQDLAGSYTVLDLDRYPVPPAGRAEHYRCASSAFAAYRDPGTPRGDVPLPAGLDDPAYADPLLIHIAALLRTVDTSATPPPPGPAEERAAEEDSAAGMPVRQALLQALCERERDRWYQLGSHLSFNPDLPVVDQVVALATLTAAGDQPCATSLLAALPNQAEVTRIGAEALVVWAHRLYSGPGYWNPLRPDLLAEQHLADTAQLAPLAAAAAQLAAGQGWEAGLFARLLAELTRGAPTHPAIEAALSELLAAALPRIVDLAVTGGHAGLADLASLALQLAPQPHQAPLVTKFANFLGEGGREGQAIQVLETTIAAAEGDPAVPAPDLLAMRWILAWHVGGKTGGRGDPQRALEIARAVVHDSATVHGPAHRETLDATITLARQVGATGNPRQALTIARELDATATAEFGASDQTTLNARFEVAVWTRAVDGAAAGAERFAELIRQAQRLEAPPQGLRHLIATSMWNLAGCLSEASDHARAIKASEEAISLARQLYGATHIKVLERRLTHADVVGESGDPQAAADLSGHLADDCADIIGESHQTTLETRYAAARWTAAAGDHTGAARRYQALLADLAGVLGDDHWLTQECRIELAELKEHPGPPHADETSARRSAQELGQRDDALTANQEAAESYRVLAQAGPDMFRPDLAMSLNTLSIRLAGLGRREQALTGSKRPSLSGGAGCSMARCLQPRPRTIVASSCLA
jgi:hypothetical protein